MEADEVRKKGKLVEVMIDRYQGGDVDIAAVMPVTSQAVKKILRETSKTFKCPVCGTQVSEKQAIRVKLSRLGYYHDDHYYKCEKCGKVLIRGIELEETKDKIPIWYGDPTSSWVKFKKKILIAIKRKMQNIEECDLCHDTMNLHKIYAETPAGIMFQLKCPSCYNVVYVIW